MGLLDNISASFRQNEADIGQFRTRNIRDYEPGQTIPPVNRTNNVAHLVSFEQLAADLDTVGVELAKNRDQMIELERLASDERRRLDEDKQHLLFKENTLKDQIDQHIESVYPNAKLVHHVPPPPDPSELDVRIESPPPTDVVTSTSIPPAIPTSEVE